MTWCLSRRPARRGSWRAKSPPRVGAGIGLESTGAALTWATEPQAEGRRLGCMGAPWLVAHGMEVSLGNQDAPSEAAGIAHRFGIKAHGPNQAIPSFNATPRPAPASRVP